MAITYLSGERIQGTSKLYADGLGSTGDPTNNGATLDTTNEKLGTGCLDFDASKDYIDADSLQPNTSMTTKGTIAFWLNLDAVTNGKKIFMISDSDGTDGQIYMEIESSGSAAKIMCGCDLGGTAQWAIRMAAGLLSASTWYHVVLTHDGTSPKVYLNGVDQTTTQVSTDLTKWVSMTAGMNSFGFGRSNYNGSTGSYLNGKLDDIGIWNDALAVGNVNGNDTGTINHLYNGGSSPRLANTIPSGLRAYYSCDSATITNNASGSEKATITNVPIGTRFEETDTRKIFRASEVDGDGDWEDATFNANWTEVSGDDFSVSGGIITVAPATNDYALASFDLEHSTALNGTSISGTAWVLQFTIDQTTWSNNTQNTYQDGFVGLSSVAGRTGDHAGLGVPNFNGKNGYRFVIINGQGHDGLQEGNSAGNRNFHSSTPVTPSTTQGTNSDGKLGIRITRTASTTFKYEIFADPTFAGTPTEYNSSDTTAAAAITSLRYLQVGGYIGHSTTPNGTTVFNIDDIKFWNGVTTPPQVISWKEKGSA
jgi:hypothetical protein